MMAVVCTPAVLAQKGCAAFDMPAGPEYGNFITGFWYAEGHAFLGHEQLYLRFLCGIPAAPCGDKREMS